MEIKNFLQGSLNNNSGKEISGTTGRNFRTDYIEWKENFLYMINFQNPDKISNVQIFSYNEEKSFVKVITITNLTNILLPIETPYIRFVINTNIVAAATDFSFELLSKYWTITENKLTNPFLPQEIKNLFEEETPLGVWTIKDNKIFQTGFNFKKGGAFYKVSTLKYISIPTTCKKIGDFSFQGTQIEKVIIPENCGYNYDTTFPWDCVVWRYEYLDNGPLITKDHKILITSDNIQINIKED